MHILVSGNVRRRQTQLEITSANSSIATIKLHRKKEEDNGGR